MNGTIEHEELMSLCAKRRERLLAKLGDGLLVVRTAPEVLRNGDVHYPHRPGSDFWYLTGFPEPDAVLVAWREARGRGHRVRTVLFVRPKDKLAEIWHGRRHGVRGAVSRFGVDEAKPIDDLFDELPKLLDPHARVFCGWATIGRSTGDCSACSGGWRSHGGGGTCPPIRCWRIPARRSPRCGR